MEVLDLRTYRDLQYVRNTEALMKGLDSRLRVAAESQKSLNAKSFQVSPTPLGAAGGGCSARRCGVGVWPGGGRRWWWAQIVSAEASISILMGVRVCQHPRGGPRSERPFGDPKPSIPAGIPEPSIPVVVPKLSILLVVPYPSIPAVIPNRASPR